MPYTTKGTRERITEALVDGAPGLITAHGAPDELIVRDADLRGFVLRLRSSGRHAYAIIWGRGRGQSRILGSTDKLTAGNARKIAREQLATVALHGAPSLIDRRRALTLRAFIDEHYAPWATEHLKAPAEAIQRLRVRFAEFLDDRLSSLSAFAIERWRTARLKAGVQKSTINRDVGALKSALSKAISWGHLQKHALAGVKPYRVDDRAVIRYLTAEEETRLLAALRTRDACRRAARDSANAWRQARGYKALPRVPSFTDHVTPIVVVAMHTGLRRGELFGLRWRDVDLVGAQLTVRGSGAKSGRTRHVPLNTIALETLRTWRGDREPAAGDLVWPGDDDQPLQDIKKAWAPVLKKAGVSSFRFHDLRHTFASRLVMAGVDLNTVRELLGHADLKMTLRYAHLAPEMKAAAVAKLVSL